MVPWHRWFGLLLNDFFANSAFEVELEPDLSLKRQHLDVLILRKHEGRLPEDLPDGLESLSTHNLLTYKSHQETLDIWAVEELIGHYVNYRKQCSTSSEPLLPESEFQLFAVSTRTPKKLHQQFDLQEVQSGVWNLAWGPKKIKILVLSEMPESSHNALWEIFSDSKKRVQQGLSTYRWHLEISSALIQQFTEYYDLEGETMPYTIEDFAREYMLEHIHLLSPEELLKNFSAEERLKSLSPEECFKHFSPEERLKSLSAEEVLKNVSPEECFKHFSPEERLKSLSPEEIRAYLQKYDLQNDLEN